MLPMLLIFRSTFPNNGPDGTYIFLLSTLNYWWIIFDNRAGVSNVSLLIENYMNTGHYRLRFRC